jgi:hypothetical protein
MCPLVIDLDNPDKQSSNCFSSEASDLFLSGDFDREFLPPFGEADRPLRSLLSLLGGDRLLSGNLLSGDPLLGVLLLSGSVLRPAALTGGLLLLLGEILLLSGDLRLVAGDEAFFLTGLPDRDELELDE